MSKIIIVMSAYNAASTLPDCLESLKAQTHKNWILLVADDGSKDNTAAVLNLAAQTDSRIWVFAHSDNKGMPARLNALIALALEEYPGSLIARMDSDDLCHPERFERQVDYLLKNPSIGVVASWGECLSPEGKLVSKTVETATDHDQIAVNSFFSAPLLHPSVMMRPAVLKELGPGIYDPSLRRAQDFDLWARLVHLTRFAVLPEYLLTYRLGADKRIHKESGLNTYRRVIVGRNLERLGIGGKDEGWMAACYALVGFPLPKVKIRRDILDQVFRDIVAANEHMSLYNRMLFTAKLEKKLSKASRRVQWRRRVLG